MIGGYGDEVPIRRAFPKHERMPDVAERETLIREWLEQIEACRDLMPTTDARGASENDHEKLDVLARNRRTKGPAIEIIAWMVF